MRVPRRTAAEGFIKTCDDPATIADYDPLFKPALPVSSGHHEISSTASLLDYRTLCLILLPKHKADTDQLYRLPCCEGRTIKPRGS